MRDDPWQQTWPVQFIHFVIARDRLPNVQKPLPCPDALSRASRECNGILRSKLWMGFQNGQMVFLQKLAMLVILIALIFLFPDDPKLMISERIITLYSLLMTLQFSLTVDLSNGIRFAFEHLICCKRIQAFLSTPLLEGETLPSVMDSKQPAVSLKSISATWSKVSY
ncbi:unnamed protein product [Dibothriocephalus latus]|uniref:Uncharacterized protein n=1 Tax=Dibothriocephalus latus TaxID=60516 RepID=A0A3P7L4J4_DIBLA|nr:unnamed protein product [Dibothriocephalus latus]